MAIIRHILFPYDFSLQCHDVARYVRAFASTVGARVTLLSVAPPTFAPVPAGMDPAVHAGDDAAQWRRALKTQLDSTLLSELADLPVDRIAEGGDPALKIVEFAKRQDVDLIMLPTHGLSRFRAMVIGSVTATVLHDAPCAVWTAAHADSQHAALVPRSILCAIDESEAAAPLARWAANLASAVGATLRLVHVVEPITDWPSLESERLRQESERERAREHVGALVRNAGVAAPLAVAIGPVSAMVVEEARQNLSDLVIIGRGSIGAPFGSLRTHAFAVVQNSPCPVLSV